MPILAERAAHVLLRVAAHRWPPGMYEEWAAELASLRARPWRMLTFAGSLAITSPSGTPRAAAAARAGTAAMLVVLLSAALFNGIHLALHQAETRLPWSGEAVLVGALLTGSLLLMATAGSRWRPRRPAVAALLIGAAAYAFLLAGNETPVMPFMGWRDVTPAVALWTAVTILTIQATLRLRTAGHTRGAASMGIGGALLAVHAAAAAGSLNAAATLGLSTASAPLWFPLAMLPGGTGGFGTYFADGQAAFGGLHGSGPAFHASDIMLANAAALTGPLLLSSAFLCAATLTRRAAPLPAPPRSEAATPLPAHLRQRAATPLPTHRRQRAATLLPTRRRQRAATLLLTHPRQRAAALLPARLRQRAATRLPARLRQRVDPLIVAAAGTAAAVLLLAGHMPRAATAAETALPRVIDNSMVFGFGFLAHPAGRAALAFAVALLLAHHLATRERQA